MVHKLGMLKEQTRRFHSWDLILSFIPDFPFSLFTFPSWKGYQIENYENHLKNVSALKYKIKEVLNHHLVSNTDVNLQANHNTHVQCGLASLYTGDTGSRDQFKDRTLRVTFWLDHVSLTILDKLNWLQLIAYSS